MTTTTTDSTREQLEARLVEQRREVEEAERRIGAAELDGSGGRAATKRLADAKDAVRRTGAALEELGRREHAEAERQAEIDAARLRLATYQYIAEYLRRAAPIVGGMDALGEAERHLQALRTDPKVYNRRTNRDRLDDQGGGDLDPGLVSRIPFARKGAFPARTIADFESIQRYMRESDRREPWTEDKVLGSAEEAEALAAAEAEYLDGAP